MQRKSEVSKQPTHQHQKKLPEKPKGLELAGAGRLRGVVYVRAYASGPVGLVFFSDQHITTADSQAWKRIKRDAEIVRDNPLIYAVLGGDMLDNHIIHLRASINSGDRPGDSWKRYAEYLSIMQGKVLLVVAGNHDLWTYDLTGFDPADHLATSSGAPYARHLGIVELCLGKKRYRVGVRHKYPGTSRINPTASAKQWIRNGEFDLDAAVICHTHVPAMESFFYRGRWRVAVRTGSYQTPSDYALSNGSDPTPVLSRPVIFFTQDGVFPFYDIEPALKAAQCIAR